jgi:hypothetical protein
MWAGSAISLFSSSAAAAQVGAEHYRTIPFQRRLAAVARLPWFLPVLAGGTATGAATVLLAGVAVGWDRRRMPAVLIRSALGWLPLCALAGLHALEGGLAEMGTRRLAVGVTGAAVVGSWGLQLLLVIRRSVWTRLVQEGRWLRFALLVFASLLPLSLWAGLVQWPTGDEPHYLLVAQSLIADRDLDIENNHTVGDYRLFYPTAISDAHAVVGRRGHWFSKHSPGLPLLIAPFYAFGGRWGVVVLMTALTACLVVSLHRLALDAGADRERAAQLGWWISFSLPVLGYANQVFPAIPVALAVSEGCRLWMDPGTRQRRAALVLVGLAVVPWLHLASAQLAAPLLLAAWFRVRRARGISWWVTGLLCLIPGLLPVFYWATLGRLLPPLGAYGGYSLFQMPRALLLLLAGQEHGVILHAPFWVAAVWGIRRAVRCHGWCPPLAIGLGYVILVASWNWWYGGWAPVGRFLVPVLPIALVPLAVAGAGVGRGERVLGGWAVLVGFALTAYPAWRYNAHDGSAAVLDAVGAVTGYQVHGLFPSGSATGFLLAGLYLAGFLCASRFGRSSGRARGEV